MRFRGEYDFLSNFYPAAVIFGGHAYPSAEHAFQASKAVGEEIRAKIAAARTAGEAKRLGGGLREEQLRPDWLAVRVKVMSHVLMDKFTRNPELGRRLLATGDLHLTEDNTWGDRFWGRCNGRGMNVLGQLLATVRAVLRDSGEWPEDLPRSV